MVGRFVSFRPRAGACLFCHVLFCTDMCPILVQQSYFSSTCFGRPAARGKRNAMSIARVFLVDDSESLLTTLQQILEHHDFEVVAASGVNDALRHIAAERFDVLLSDLHMPGRGDGLTVVSAMRHANPQAITLVFSGYPEMQAAANAILLQADEILVKPLSVPDLIAVIRQKLQSRAQSAARVTESVATILESDSEQIIQDWLTRVKDHKRLMQIPLSAQERTGHLPRLLEDLVTRLRQPRSPDEKHPDSK